MVSCLSRTAKGYLCG